MCVHGRASSGSPILTSASIQIWYRRDVLLHRTVADGSVACTNTSRRQDPLPFSSPLLKQGWQETTPLDRTILSHTHTLGVLLFSDTPLPLIARTCLHRTDTLFWRSTQSVSILRNLWSEDPDRLISTLESLRYIIRSTTPTLTISPSELESPCSATARFYEFCLNFQHHRRTHSSRTSSPHPRFSSTFTLLLHRLLLGPFRTNDLFSARFGVSHILLRPVTHREHTHHHKTHLNI